MRTLEEINRDLQTVTNKLDKGENISDDEFNKLIHHFKKLTEEKKIVWETLYEGHRNCKI